MGRFGNLSRRQRAWPLLAIVAALGVMPACTLWNRGQSAPPPTTAAPDASAAPAMSTTPALGPTGATATTPVAPAPSTTASGMSGESASTSSRAGKPAPAAHVPPSRTARGVTPAGATASAAPGSATAGAAVKPTQPALDLAALEQRLKDTKAIGVFTKLSLKNQVDDLLEEFKKFHRTAGASPPPSLRSQYDLLMSKVLSLLQDGDPQLAASISSSREALWNILKDPNKFAKI